VNAYARSLPTLGFDPAPGDVDLTRNLAQRHYQIAHETRQVLALVERLDLSALQGRAADALRAAQSAFPPALRNTVSVAETLQEAASSWANQLGGFQAEADALERQAAAAAEHQQALQVRQTTLPAGSIVLADDLQAASGAVNGIHGQARELHQRYMAAAGKTAAGVEEHKGLWEGTEPVRKVLEAVLAPLDIALADHWVSALEKIAGVPSELVQQVAEKVEDVQKLADAGKFRIEELIAAGKFAESAGGKYDAWYAFAPNWLKTAAGSIAEIRGLSYTLSGLGLVADVGTVISPQNQGALGWVDRGAAGANGLLIGADLALDVLPGVGEVALAATGIYLAGDYLYQHWTPFRNVANAVGHATVNALDGTAHEADSAWHDLDSGLHAVTSIGSLI
jgi:hypothetical protein